MSKENIAKFQETLAQKPELLEKLRAARTPEAVVAAAQAEGFDFTAEELAEYRKAAAPSGMNSGAAAQRELDPEELEKVAAGGTVFPLDNFVKCEYAYTRHCNSWCQLFGTCCCVDGYYDPDYESLRRPF